jgi:hypothetical protein
MFQNIDWVVPRGATTQTLGSKAMEGTNMTAEEKKKVAVDFLRLAGQGHPREMQGVLKAGGIHRTQDIVVEVFVGREASHCPAARRASKRALRPSGGNRTSISACV